MCNWSLGACCRILSIASPKIVFCAATPFSKRVLGRDGGLTFQGQAYLVVLEHFVGPVQKIEDLRHSDLRDSLIQYLFDLIEGFSRSIPGRGDHEFPPLHFAARAILPAGVSARANSPSGKVFVARPALKTSSTYLL